MVEALATAPPGELPMLASGCRAMLDDQAPETIASFIRGRGRADGGFCGRSSASDLYYTLFAVDGLIALDRLVATDGLVAFVERHGDGEGLDLVHLCCLARLLARLGDPHRRLPSVVHRLTGWRSPAGGYRLSPDAGHDSVYASYLALLVGGEVGVELVEPEDAAAAAQGLRAADGGFGDRPGLAVGTTTVTSAAALISALAGRPDQAAVRWLQRRVCTATGFRASPVTPLPDLLSTASALFALWALGESVAGLKAGCLELVDGLWDDSGGFTGHQLDDTPDCEYTFYALLVLGLCAGAV